MTNDGKQNARFVAAEVLHRVFFKGSYSHLALDEELRSKSLENADQRFVTEVVYGTVKRKNTIDYILNAQLKQPVEKNDKRIQTILRLSVYQMFYMDRVPERAAIHEAVELASRWGRKGLKGSLTVFYVMCPEKGNRVLSTATERISLTTSHPEWLVNRWLNDYGEVETLRMCEENTKRGSTTLRTNTREVSRSDLQIELSEEHVQTHEGNIAPEALRVLEGHARSSSAYERGRFTIQDESSMLVARALDPKAGMTVLDACAAPGGKTTHIAELMNDEGTVVANDIHEHKQRLINQQVNRLGLTCVSTRTSDAKTLPDQFPSQTFDRILVDAPCSGLGVLRNKPDIKWNTDEERIKGLPVVQQEILQQVAPLLKDFGVLVYSTCTVLPEENEHVIRKFMETHPEFAFDRTLSERLTIEAAKTGQCTILPHHYGSDGFYICALIKKGSADS
ncbi:LOW QUALITY PROTEIN: ribosomal RNA small subunit methyltransferase B [Geomicrobium sp. JCM 19037]|nr:LOW QUALITY PROTEIN: ribosomal RNA small subunit methyltransferase B [Geomicrobium sp. JCM 19037]